MKKNFLKSVLARFVCLSAVLTLAVNAQEFTVETNSNWNGIPNMPTVETWNFPFSPDWYFWAGFGLGFFLLLYGVIMGFFENQTRDSTITGE
jgi:hypothetical protein